MKYFQELIEELNLSNDYLPLWKVIDRMNQSHVDSLVDYIQEHTSMNRNVCYYAQEVCLLYAYWWQKISQGRRGGHNYMDIISDMNLTNVKEEQLKDAVLYELQTAQKLNIPIYKSNTTRWLDSVLAQGGIPLQWMTNLTNTDYILRFLKALLHHYENIIIPDWYNTSIAEEMAKQYNMPAYAQNQAYCGYCLSIVQSIIMKESIVSGSSIVQNIINQVAQEHNNYEYRLFGITWFIKANQRGDYSICYTLKVPKSIDISEESETSSRRYYLNGKFVAEYLRQGDKFYLQQGTNIPTFEIIQDETEALFLEQMEDNGVLEGVPMYNSIMPVIEEPVSLRYDSADYWNLNTNNGGERIAIICPAGWKPVSDLPYKNVRLQNEDYLWIEVDWSNSTHEHIELRKGEESYFVYKNNIDYELYLNFPQFDWIEKASRLIVDSSANLSHCIYVRDSEGNPISASKWKLYIKSAEDFVPYTKTTRLSSGLNTMRICMPDNRSKYIRFFYVQSVNYRRTSGNSFSFDCNDIDLHLIPNQDVTQVDSTYTCNKQVLSVGFQLSSNGSDMILHVSSPKPDSSFWSIENGKKMLSNSNISINDLHKYKVYRNGRDKLHISYKSNYDETIVTNSTIELGSDQFTTLSFISGILERMLVLYPLTRARRIELTISNSTITIVTDPYNLFTLKDEEGLKIQVSYNNEIQKDIPLAAINLDEILDENFTIIDLPAANDDGYCLVPESISSTPFIVFSKDPSRRFPTELIDVNEEELPLEEHIRRRNSRKAESIAKINEVLSGDNYKNWGTCVEANGGCNKIQITVCNIQFTHRH